MTLASVTILQNKNEGSQVINILRGATKGKVYYSFQLRGSVSLHCPRPRAPSITFTRMLLIRCYNALTCFGVRVA